MQTISIEKFNLKSKIYLDEVIKNRSEIVLTRRGKPSLRIISLDEKKKNKDILKGSIVFEKDIISPIRTK